MDIPNWVAALAAVVSALVAVIGAPIASYTAVQRIVTKLVTQMEMVLDSMRLLNKTTAEGTLQAQENKLKLDELSRRLTVQSERIESVAKRNHDLADEITPYHTVIQILCEKNGIPWRRHD